jgi:hypothetical protein
MNASLIHSKNNLIKDRWRQFPVNSQADWLFSNFFTEN